MITIPPGVLDVASLALAHPALLAAVALLLAAGVTWTFRPAARPTLNARLESEAATARKEARR